MLYAFIALFCPKFKDDSSGFSVSFGYGFDLGCYNIKKDQSDRERGKAPRESPFPGISSVCVCVCESCLLYIYGDIWFGID